MRRLRQSSKEAAALAAELCKPPPAADCRGPNRFVFRLGFGLARAVDPIVQRDALAGAGRDSYVQAEGRQRRRPMGAKK